MRSDSSVGLRVAGHPTCVVYDKKTGEVAHSHDCITFEGAELPSRSTSNPANAANAAISGNTAGVKLDRL